MDVAWVALLGTVFAGAGLKAVEAMLSRGQKKNDAAAQMRDELRKEGEALKAEAAKLREEIRTVEKELDQWKEKYYILLQNYLELKNKAAEETQDW